jgi:hypothetical protein
MSRDAVVLYSGLVGRGYTLDSARLIELLDVAQLGRVEARQVRFVRLELARVHLARCQGLCCRLRGLPLGECLRAGERVSNEPAVRDRLLVRALCLASSSSSSALTWRWSPAPTAKLCWRVSTCTIAARFRRIVSAEPVAH